MPQDFTAAPTDDRGDAVAQARATQDTYIRAVVQFTRFLGRSPDTATAEDMRRYQLHCVNTGVSAITLNATIIGLKFFFDTTLDRPELIAKMHPVRVTRKCRLF